LTDAPMLSIDSQPCGSNSQPNSIITASPTALMAVATAGQQHCQAAATSMVPHQHLCQHDEMISDQLIANNYDLGKILKLVSSSTADYISLPWLPYQ